MMIRQFLAAAMVLTGVSGFMAAATAQPLKRSCSASFVLSEKLGSFAFADLKDAGVDRFYVEMGPSRAALTMKGAGVSGAYKASTPDLMIWNYMSIYEPAEKWLEPGSVRFDYSGFRVGWPEFRLNGKVVKTIKLTVTRGDRSMAVDVSADAKGFQANDRVFAIDFEAMLAGRFPALRVDDQQGWRKVSDAGRPTSVTLTDASNGKVIARGEAPPLATDVGQPLLSGAVNALREKYKAGKCV